MYGKFILYSYEGKNEVLESWKKLNELLLKEQDEMGEAMVEKNVNAINESLINFFKQGTTSNLGEMSYGTNNIGVHSK
jgi:hypothetical protein